MLNFSFLLETTATEANWFETWSPIIMIVFLFVALYFFMMIDECRE